MARSLGVEALSVRGFRNLEPLDLQLGPGFNVFAGDNGQGKTNLLEAVYAVLTSKSFRASRPGEVVKHGGDVASVRARVVEEGDAREQSVGLKTGARVAKIDGKKPRTLAEYAITSPVVVFHPGLVALSTGGGADRRRLLDRIALYARAASLVELESYERAIRERQKAMETRGVDARDVPHWEELAVRHGLAVMEARAEAAERIAEAARHAFANIAPPGAALGVTYEPGAPRDEAAYRAKLEARRPADLRRGAATSGPHRDDLTLAIDGRGVRGVASQGQHRAVVLALKLAEIAVIAAARGVRPVLLLDDVSSELDAARTDALFAFLRTHEGQVLLTTTRPELVPEGGSGLFARRDFRVASGRVSASSSS